VLIFLIISLYTLLLPGTREKCGGKGGFFRLKSGTGLVIMYGNRKKNEQEKE
jgi:hypothetical protein